MASRFLLESIKRRLLLSEDSSENNMYNYLERLLAPAGEITLDYSIFGVAFKTLGLLLIVELIRHRLDVVAAHRPFFKTILSAVYQELSTLGIVEFFVYLMQKYLPYNKKMKYVFAEVHFMLFFVAMLNAVLMVLMAFITTRISTRMWVKAEEMDLDYYLGLRMEFERVRNDLKGLGIYEKLKYNLYTSTTQSRSENDSIIRATKRTCFTSISHSLQLFWIWLLHPRLISNYKKLLIPIRFHEMRIHFLMANDLPKTFRVSQYLKRSELNVLNSLAHINIYAWLGLMAGFDLLYYFLGLSHYERDKVFAYNVFSVNLIGLSLLCVFVTLAIHNKMKTVFHEIISTEFIHRTSTRKPKDETFIDDSPDMNQLKLFWDADPEVIIVMLQMMQFYFAITAAYFLTFWGTAMGPGYEGEYAEQRIIGWGWDVVAAVFSYLSFLFIMANVLPIYTLCTNLGQLVNIRILTQTLALWKLETIKHEKTMTMDGASSTEDNRFEKLADFVLMPSDELPQSQRSKMGWADKIAHFLHTKYYRIFDFTFGSMVALYLVGMRMELLLTEEGHMEKSYNTWQLTLGKAFLLELIWLAVFVVTSIFIICFFTVKQGLYGGSTMIIAAGLDLSISGTCIGLLVLAESLRCCEFEPFGYNTGLGYVEPWTGIIFFRSFRFVVARWFIEKISVMDYNHPSNELMEHNHGNGHGHEIEDMQIMELWNKAVGEHPEIVKEYGEFSDEMLQTMLGIPLNKKKHDNIQKDPPTNAFKHNDLTEETKEGIVSKLMEQNPDTKQQAKPNTKALHIDTRFLTLPEEVLEVICAGKVGKPVTIVSTASNTVNDLDHGRQQSKVCIHFHQNTDEKLLEEHHKFMAPDAQVTRSMRRCQWKLIPMLKYWALVDVVMSKYEIVLLEASDMEDLEESSDFNNDNDAMPASLNTIDTDVARRKRFVHSALVATEGGRGLRLRDVALGRKVVGHLKFADITSATVDRIPPATDSTSSYSSTSRSIHKQVSDHFSDVRSWSMSNVFNEMLGDENDEEINTEYYKVDSYFDCSPDTVASRWENVTEDRMKLVSKHGTLYLRFFSDLEKMELNSEFPLIQLMNGHVVDRQHKEITDAFVWCRTIAKACGILTKKRNTMVKTITL